MKPNWKDAPEWAKWLAFYIDGSWAWCEIHPAVLSNFPVVDYEPRPEEVKR